MRTTLILDDTLIERARGLTGVAEKTALVHEGLRALIARESARRVAEDNVLALTMEHVGVGKTMWDGAWRATPKSPLKAGEDAVVIRGVFYSFGVD